MPIITIKEEVVRRNAPTLGTDIPFIPGFTGASGGKHGVPVLCKSVYEFEKAFGTTPVNVEIEEGKNEYDKSYIMAKELITAGMPVYYCALYRGENDSIDHALGNYFADTGVAHELEDKGEYSIKYITSGGYANFVARGGVCKEMLRIAANRGDCVALVEDSEDNTTGGSFYERLQTADLGVDVYEFGTAFTPWAGYTLAAEYGNLNLKTASLPASFGYLLNLAKTTRTSPNWLAMAGTTRGVLTNITALNTTIRLSNTLADSYQPMEGNGSTRALNAITNIRPYGYCIWGNRTLKGIGEKLDATHFLNIRNMLSDIKKVAYSAARDCMYEQNTETVWIDFKAKVTPFLDQLKAGSGISSYKLLKVDVDSNGQPYGPNELACVIKIYPINSIEAITIDIELHENDVSVN